MFDSVILVIVSRSQNCVKLFSWHGSVKSASDEGPQRQLRHAACDGHVLLSR